MGCGERLIDVPEARADTAHRQRQQERQELLESFEQWDRQFDEKMAEHRRSVEAREARAEAEFAKAKTRPPVRKVRRWAWESPGETRSKLWNVPLSDDTVATATGLLRICMTEADGDERDCVAIWQVLNNIRSSKCDRARIRRITECDAEGETLLSAMRRAQKYALGVVPPRSRRTRWIAALELDCEQPADYPGSVKQWRSQYERQCASTSKLVRKLVDGEHVAPVIRRARAIAWGGRCEDPRGACDDPLACERGLVRIRGTETHNAFWRRARSQEEIDPICQDYLRRRGG
jgi:hypothetical protein